MKRLLASLTLLAAVGATHAGIVNHADVNGMRTFQDTGTGRVWLDLDSFRDAGGALLPGIVDTDSMRVFAAAAGFVIAREAEVKQVTDLLPLVANDPVVFGGYEAILASTHGAGFWPGIGDWLAGWMLSDDPTQNWMYMRSARLSSSGWASTFSGGFNTNEPAWSPVGLWAYLPPAAGGGGGGGGGNVPEPASLALAVLGLTAVARSRRRLTP